MSARTKKLLEDRASAWSQVQDIRTRLEREGRDPSAEENETYERGLADVERLSKEIDREDRAERLGRDVDDIPADQRSTNPVPDADTEDRDDTAEAYARSFAAYLRRGVEGVRPEDREAFQDGFVEDRAQAAGVDAAGGYTVPKEFLTKMVEAMKSFGGVQAEADVLNTATGRDLSWPTNDDTSNKGAILAENTQAAEQDVAFGTVGIKAFMYTSKMVRVSFQLLQDSAFNLNVWLPTKLGERIGRASAEHFATGSGVGQPQGIITGLAAGHTAAKITYDALVDLEHSVNSAYRNRPGAGYVLSDSALAEIRKLKDSQGRPLWVPSMVAGVPSTVNGKKYAVDDDFPTAVDGNAPVVYGDIKEAYVVRVVNGAQTLRLTERYADFLQVGFLGFARLDGKVQNGSAAKKLLLDATP